MLIENLGIGTQTLSNLLEMNCVYVDKTRMIHDLLTDGSIYHFLARPRRFGKSLLLDTIEQILKGRSELFKGFDIMEPKLGYKWERSHVIRIDMSDFKDVPCDLSEYLAERLTFQADRLGIRFKAKTSGDALFKFLTGLYDYYDKIPLDIGGKETGKADLRKTALLIDEYDTPITFNISHPDNAEAARQHLHVFYGTLKAREPLLRTVFITGITNFSKLSLLSALNNLNDITFAEDFSTICGFTSDEIHKYFRDHLQSSLSAFQGYTDFGPGFTADDFFRSIMEWYDGYSWDGISRVLNPHSLLSLFKNNAFGNYWFQTGGSTHVQDLDILAKFFGTQLNDNYVFAGKIGHDDIVAVKPETILMQAGYLTLRKPDPLNSSAPYDLVVPNKEIRKSITKDYIAAKVIPALKTQPEVYGKGNYLRLYKAFCKHRSGEAQRLMSHLFSKIPWDMHTKSETFYNALLYTFFNDLGDCVLPQDPSATGKTDLVIKGEAEEILVVEIKYDKADHLADFTVDPDFQAQPDFDGNENVAAGFRYADDRTAGSKHGIQANGNPGKLGFKRASSARKMSSKEKEVAVGRVLDHGIGMAFKQIEAKRYLLKYLEEGKVIYAVAVSICGTTHVRIKFKKGEWPVG
ncbi:MAG: AAA family ATPase [Deltaproteobacteria bacterium]|nr:AAA family ATPase [Deltaproteobacteria bacterium]